MSDKRQFRSRSHDGQPGYPELSGQRRGRLLAALGTAAALAGLSACGAAPNPAYDLSVYDETDAGRVDAGPADGGSDAGR